jgi:hypothetical protein
VSRLLRTARGWRLPALLALAVVAAGVVIALLQPAPANGYLDPDGTGPTGSRALADLLTARGERVVRVTAPPSASAAPGSLELITGAGSLTAAQVAQAGRFDGDILLIASGDVASSEPHAQDDMPGALRAIAPAVHFTGYEATTVARPECTVQAAAVSGTAYFYGVLLRSTAPGSQSCYPAGHGGYSLVRYTDGARTITVLGSSAPLSNAYLSSQGDAALSLNLLRSARQIIWVVPAPQAQADAAPGQRSFFSLVPWPAYLVAIQLGIAVLLAAAWRARRLGPLVAERLPVMVRAAETVEGHGRLYQARRARDRAAGELRAAASARIAQVTGSGATTEAIAARTGLPAARVTTLLHGPPPPTDQALVTLAAELDTLERKIRQS